MHPVLRALYASALGVGLVPYAIGKIRRTGFGSLHVAERLARTKFDDSRPLWVNAASVGELGVAAALIDQLRALHPGLPVFLTHSAEAARPLASSRLGLQAQAVPLDFPAVANRFFDRLRPRMCVMIEQELWPVMIGEAARRGTPVAIVNGRLSRRSARRHARLAPFSRGMMASLDLVAAQSRADARRFEFLGVPRVETTGNIKFDAKADASKVAAGLALRKRLAKRHPGKSVLLIASTRADPSGVCEERMLLEALQGRRDKLVLLIVPRHPERFGEVAALLRQLGVEHVARSAAEDAGDLPACILGDTMGEMDMYIAAADMVFVGASLVDKGGQNPMEALRQGKPVIMGPYTSNFAELVAAASGRKALLQKNSAASVADAALELAGDESRRKNMGAAGLEIARGRQGALPRTVELLKPMLVESGLLEGQD